MTNEVLPAGEQSCGNSVSAWSAEEISWQVSSDSVPWRNGVPRPVVDMLGFIDGRCLTMTHKQTSIVAKTRDFPGTMSPVAPPSPRGVSGALAGTLPSDGSSGKSNVLLSTYVGYF